jgi:hypothetical protein
MLNVGGNGLVPASPSSSAILNGSNNIRRTNSPPSPIHHSHHHHHHQLQNLHNAPHLHQHHHSLQHSHHHLLAAVAAAKQHVSTAGSTAAGAIQYQHENNNDGSPLSPPTMNGSTNVLNLSRRGTTISRNVEMITRQGAASPYEVSSGTGSGEDEHLDCENSGLVVDQHNSLPLKLRHKSHLGDKDAATALLALHNIKQEPNLRESPPSWDGEGSSDERDSGISSLGTGDWTSLQALQATRKIVAAAAAASAAVSSLENDNLQNHTNVQGTNHLDKDEENIHLKSQLARLESEVATIKNMMCLNTNSGTAAAQ